MTAVTVTSPNTLPIAGTPVSYSGSLAEHHGPGFILFPLCLCGEGSDCAHDPGARHTLLDFGTNRALHHVRTGSYTAARTDSWWPSDAIDVIHGGYLYKAAYTWPGSRSNGRVLAFYAGNGRIHGRFIVAREITDAIRTLDDRGADPARAQCKTFALPALTA